VVDFSFEDFDGYEGCNEVFNVIWFDVVWFVYDVYFEVGVDVVEINIFGVNFVNLGEYGISDCIYDLLFVGVWIVWEVVDVWLID